VSNTSTIEVIAGLNPTGAPIIERLNVQQNNEGLQVLTAPLFAGVAKHDIISVDNDKHFRILQHSGNLNIRVVSRTDAVQLLDIVAKGIEGLGGEISNQSERFFTITAHVSCEFRKVEAILEHMMKEFPDTSWAYTNVFHPETGEPLNWWVPILSEQ